MQLKTLKTAIQTDYSDLPAHWLTDWLLHVINQPASFLITDSDYQLTENEQTKLMQGIEKMQAGQPLAYLLGKQEFWSLQFLVNEHTLIPRPDTEVLVEQVLQWIQLNQPNIATQRLLDLGTGSGCIAISLAHELAKNRQDWSITAVDYSLEALQVAEQNSQLNQVDNIQFVHSSWYDKLTEPQSDSQADSKPASQINTSKTFSVIVSNPPYIDKNDGHLNQLLAEPITALVADKQGLADIEIIVAGAKNHLTSNGLLAIEHGYDQAEAVQAIFSQYEFKEIKTVKDYGGNDRLTMGVLS